MIPKRAAACGSIGLVGAAFAHVLIGYNDVGRIRAEEVAAEREKLAVLNRVVRHNLRTEAQTLTCYAELLAAEVDPESEPARYATTIRDRARSLGGDGHRPAQPRTGDRALVREVGRRPLRWFDPVRRRRGWCGGDDAAQAVPVPSRIQFPFSSPVQGLGIAPVGRAVRCTAVTS